MKRKMVGIEVLEKGPDGGRIVISTGTLDRDMDRVIPTGGQLGNYLKNPVVQWGHNYREPWATIGKTTALEITEAGIEAEFELRPAANDQDPQNVVRLLWEGGWVRSASIGFRPTAAPRFNDDGGFDFEEWELLEWSLVPVPANQEALARVAKSLGLSGDEVELYEFVVDADGNLENVTLAGMTVVDAGGQGDDEGDDDAAESGGKADDNGLGPEDEHALAAAIGEFLGEVEEALR